jgi:hypothetical protein
VAWGLITMKPARVLSDNKFLLEFESDEDRTRIVDDSMWRHREDVVLIVPYDVFSPPSSIVINTIGLWARFYDLPDVLRKEEHARGLGSQLGQVVRTDMSYPNYVRVKILFPLANALLASTKVRIRGTSDMDVIIRYENIPFFCFICGRIGHSDKDCPEGEVGARISVLEWSCALLLLKGLGRLMCKLELLLHVF